LTPAASAPIVRLDFRGLAPPVGFIYQAKSMGNAGNGGDPGKLGDLGRRLDQALKSQRKPGSEASQEGSAAGLALRVITELAVGIIVTMGLGWMADKYFGTTPWLMLAFMPFGFAAGVFNVMRLANSKSAGEILGGRPGDPVAPSVKDDEDD
jgi:ATP synthase protein I